MLKQYVIVPLKPKMSKGKIASQVAHATFLALEKYRYKNKINKLSEWTNNSMCVIVLECKDVIALHSADEYLTFANIQHHLYIDEGLTEVEPFTPTALATGIVSEEDQWMFEKFKLFGHKWYE